MDPTRTYLGIEDFNFYKNGCINRSYQYTIDRKLYI